MAERAAHADVLVIGAGASGAVAALRLVEAGFSVVTLEQGDWPDRDSFRGDQPDWEISATRRWSAFPARPRRSEKSARPSSSAAT